MQMCKRVLGLGDTGGVHTPMSMTMPTIGLFMQCHLRRSEIKAAWNCGHAVIYLPRQTYYTVVIDNEILVTSSNK